MKYHLEFWGVNACFVKSVQKRLKGVCVLNWAATAPLGEKESYLCLRSWRMSLNFSPFIWAMGIWLVSELLFNTPVSSLVSVSIFCF